MRWLTLIVLLAVQAPAARSGNPILQGWYADPEVHVFAGQYWIYPTYSAPYNEQLFLDAFSSPDLVTWTKHARVLDAVNVKWATRAMWAPSIIERDGWYYLFFGANDIQNDQQIGGIGVAALGAHAVTIQDPQPPQQPPQINVEVKREGGGGRWYMSPTWMAIGAIALVLLVLLVALAARGSGGGGGTTVVRG